jgi:glycosyltransferase involved in cell wall biosynthesis
MTLSVLIPVFNEERTIRRLLEKVCHVELSDNIRKEIIIIDDGSTDSTKSICSDFIKNHPSENIIYHSLPSNQGKGSAIRKGIALASGKWIIIQDADLEYDPDDYNPLLEKLITERLDVIYGSRLLNKTNRYSYRRFYLGGRLVTWITNILYRQKLTDEPTCYKLFDACFLKSIPLCCKGFEFCPEVTAKTAKRGIHIKEIPIRYYPRSVKEGKKINWKDGLMAIFVLLKYRLIN